MAKELFMSLPEEKQKRTVGGHLSRTKILWRYSKKREQHILQKVYDPL